MQEFRPALVYRTADNNPSYEDGLEEVLYSRRLYDADAYVETSDALALPVGQRPGLIRIIRMLRAGFADALICHRWEDIGDEKERAAIVGAVLHFTRDVVVGGNQVEGDWYRDQVRRLGYPPVAEIMNPLIMGLQFSHHAEAYIRQLGPGDDWFVETTMFGRSTDLARLRAEELFDEGRGMTPTAIARRLQVEGWRNREDRVIWYPSAVTRILER